MRRQPGTTVYGLLVMRSKPTRSKWNRILVIVFFLTAIVLAVWGSLTFKRMIDDEVLQEKLDEIRPSDGRS